MRGWSNVGSFEPGALSVEQLRCPSGVQNEQTVGLHVYREYGPSEKILGVVFFLGGGVLEIARTSTASPSVTLWMQVRDVRAEEDRLGAAGVEVVKPVERMPWGLVEAGFTT